MHIIIALVTLLGALAVWYWRIKMAREAGGQLVDAAGDLRARVRRLMYQRKHNVHPADEVDDPRLAAAGIVVAVATMDAPISQAEMAALDRSARRIFDVSPTEAEDIVAFGRWISDQCGTNAEAVRRLSRTVKRLSGVEAAPDLIAMIEEVATADGHSMGEDEMDALDTVRRTLGAA